MTNDNNLQYCSNLDENRKYTNPHRLWYIRVTCPKISPDTGVNVVCKIYLVQDRDDVGAISVRWK